MKNIITLFLLITSFGATAQVTRQIRKEFDLKETDATSVLVLGRKGMLTYGAHKDQGVPPQLEINRFNTDMELVGTVNSDWKTRGYIFRTAIDFDTTKVYFYQQGKGRDVLITTYDIATGAVSSYEHKLEYSFYANNMTILNGMLILSGTSSKKACFVTLDPVNGTQNMVMMPGVNRKRILESFVRDDSGKSITILYRDGTNMKLSTLFLTIMDSNGDMTLPVELDRDERYSIIDGTISWLNDKEFILSGTYGTKNSSLASGMYVSKWNNFQQQFITYHSFADFEKFFDYLPARQQARVEKKAAKKKNQGKENYIKSLVTIHPAVSLEKGYTVVGEVFHATYRTEYYTTYVNGRPVQQTRQVFDGYQYTHAVVMGIDETGSLIYDHCFPMWLAEKPYSPRRNLRITRDNTKMEMVFCSGSTIVATTVDGPEISTREVGSVGATEVEGDAKVMTYGSGSQYWYDNYYVMYFFQRIKNKGNEAVEKRRNVFVINKVEYTK